jgi:hypothetical protein
MHSVDTQATETLERMARDDYRRELGNGLVLRWTAPEDLERVVAMYATVFRRNAEAPPNAYMPLWVRDMFSGRHPHIGPRDFAVVEHEPSGTIVAATCLLRYDCAYEGIPFGFGRPEIVGSLPEYRRQGLIRAIFELIHARSTARGDLAQGITGIAYYYRQFGYEYAVALEDELTVSFAAIPPLKAGETEPYTLREATLDDIPKVQRLWEREAAKTGLWTTVSADYWRWLMTGMNPQALERWRIYMIVEADGRSVGAALLSPGRWAGPVGVNGMMVEAGVPLVRVTPSVLRGLQALAPTTRPIRPETPPAGGLNLRWTALALRDVLTDVPHARSPYPYPWYLRVPDLPAFLRHILPVLERRLAESAEAGYTGELTIDFYRGGLRLALENGKLAAIEVWQRPVWGEAKAGFPPLVFLQVLFGHRTLHELRCIYPDVWAEGDATALLNALFPKRSSLLMPLD